MDFLVPLEEIKKQILYFRNDSELDVNQLRAQLVSMGYELVGQVEMPGQFSVRGGIIDIYCLTEENPWRIELWGDEIDSIRSFDAQSQRSIENLDEIVIYPAAEQQAEKAELLFWIILIKISLWYFWMNPTVFLKMPGLWRRSSVGELQQQSGKRRTKSLGRMDVFLGGALPEAE